MRYIAALITILIATAAAAQTSEPTAIPAPAAEASWALDANDGGEIIGTFLDASGQHAFRYSRGRVDAFTVPGSIATDGSGINARGDVVGAYVDAMGVTHGYLRMRSGVVKTVDVPGAVATLPTDVSKTFEVVGYFVEALPGGGERLHGFLMTSEGLQVIDNPFGELHTVIEGINDVGVMVGWMGGDQDSPKYGFMLHNGNWIFVNYPGAAETLLHGISSDLAVVGYANVPGEFPSNRQFVYRGGLFIDVPPHFFPYGVNALSAVVGLSLGIPSMASCLALDNPLACP